ncbi:MAG: hypothetical protein KDC66_19760 [Phaeodactylibacter sp.]|nr:hypothetical protein [Phaeodactylibacter sp.]MCB9274055.1 hypothetical protein [Lewinellaceae bacterium]
MKKILIAVLLLAVIGLGVGYMIYNKPFENMNRAKADMAMSATELFTAYENDEAAANSKFLDKIIEVSGTVKEANTDEAGNISITLECGSDMFGVICQLDNLAEQPRKDFKEGESLTLKGICTGMLMDVVLVRCVLV